MSEEEIKKVARETFLENVMKNFDSVVIFEYIQTLERENTQLKKEKDDFIKAIIELIEEIVDLKSVLKEIREYIIKELLDDNLEYHKRNSINISGSDLPNSYILRIIDILDKTEE